MANWAFEIDYANNFIVGLTEVLVDKGFRICCLFNDGQPLYLFSSEYLMTTPDEKVNVQARQLVRFIDGLSYLVFENKENVDKVTLTTVIDMNTLGTVNLQRVNNIPTTLSIDFSVYKPMIEDEENPMAHLLKLVPSEVFIRDLLLVLSHGMDFNRMHQAFDLVKSKLDGLDFPLATLVRFLKTARREDIENPMPLKEAQELISDIIFAVLEKYYRIHLKHCVVKDRNAEWDDMYDSLYD
ncbi:hypothetical protein [Chitinophaga sp. LS1]|uniref:hypothetical protein n=1 Tax=Chitinophaga sp. LS1 TaxID=3051176 RepID=UPI002AAAB5DB|nr:hypothetical protein [Chitinophaga sp. LS1]WPV68010.1 hypothetical protein QQL36_04625 [Chitinophaga sp. LS1]